MFDKEKFEDLLREIADLTSQGKVEWSPAASVGDMFFCHFGKVRISVRKDESIEGDSLVPTLVASLLTSTGDIASEVAADHDDSPVPRLFELARASARNSDRLLKTLSLEIQKLQAS